MQRYWVKIALGSLAVFVIGMIVIAMCRSVLRHAESLANSNRPISIPLALLPFRVDGDQLGTVKRLELIRSAPKHVTGVRLTVNLQDSNSVDQLRDCNLTVHEGAVLGGREGFTCATAGDSTSERLERIGEIVIEPGGTIRALLAPAAQVAEWRSSLYDTASAQAELAALKAEQLADSAAQAVVIRADSTRAVIDIRGDSARSLVHIQADSHGAMMRIRDRRGREILHLHADSTGASLTVSADSAQAHKR